MTLSQIIAKDSKFDKEIPSVGHWAVRLEIQNGCVVFAEVTEKIKKEEPIPLRGGHGSQYSC